MRMLSHTRAEVGVGLFTLLGVAALAYLSVSVGGVDVVPPERYTLHARFSTVGDLKPGATIKLAGVPVGRVGDIRIADYAAEVELHLQRSLALPLDTIAEIRTEGLLGEPYVSLSPGASDQMLAAGERVEQTQPPVDLLDLIGRFAFGSVGDAPEERKEDSPSPFPDLLAPP